MTGNNSYLAGLWGLLFILVAGLGGCGDDSAKAGLQGKAEKSVSKAEAGKKAGAPASLPAVSRSRYATTTLLDAILLADSPVAGKIIGKGQYVGGLRVDLAYGWKTYWRSPGDSGVPPSFDWSGSENVKKVDVKWPAPKRFVDEAGQSIGYKKHVLLPLIITPEDPARPVTLKLKMFYGVCSDICVPVQAGMGVVLSGKGKAKSNVSPVDLEKAVRNLPLTGPGKGFAIHSARIVSLVGKKAVLRIAARFPEGSAHTDLFAERLDGEYIPFARKLDGKDKKGAHLFEISLDEEESARELAAKKLKLTLVSDQGAAEVIVVPVL